MPLVELWDNVAFLNLRDLCRWKEGLPVLLVAHGGVLVPPYHLQSQKNPVSMSAMLTGKFLQIRKVFANPESFCKKYIIG